MTLSTLAASVAIALVTFVVVASAVALGVLIALAVVVKVVTPRKDKLTNGNGQKPADTG